MVERPFKFKGADPDLVSRHVNGAGCRKLKELNTNTAAGIMMVLGHRDDRQASPERVPFAWSACSACAFLPLALPRGDRVLLGLSLEKGWSCIGLRDWLFSCLLARWVDGPLRRLSYAAL